jgi:hypothetical protein
MAETAKVESPPKVSAKALAKEPMKAGLTLKVSEKASRNARLKVKWIVIEPGKTMAFLKACWKL